MGQSKRIIISGGGTGGHVAIAIANALKRIDPSTEILFVGAKNRMEMERVPAAGYQIKGLDIQGFQRKSLLKNFLLPFKMIKSIFAAAAIIRQFKPDAVVGVGGYASFPLLFSASKMNIPYLIQEQNSYAGIVNKFLGKHAKRICVAFEGMGKFFPANKIMLTGNPIRKESVTITNKRAEAFDYFELSPEKKTLLVLGGSLGSNTLNQSMLTNLDQISSAGIQLIWQTGSSYYLPLIKSFQTKDYPNIKLFEFLNHMDFAYATADVIISRAGAGTIAELCAIGEPTHSYPAILVPSPHVTEDHQTKNAMALVQKEAAFLVTDQEAGKKLIPAALSLIKDKEQCTALSKNIAALAKPNADEIIAHEILKIAN